ncbi:MAG TPA: threonylcarbamoyl-AMP synthase [Planctomycetaceae bacterium]|nr:threonylcarbamoyl-AMP synthase [Planctomycetaceae bacterium]
MGDRNQGKLTTQVLSDHIAAAKIIQRGGVVAFPTETVFGLGADATNPTAVARIFSAKGRPGDNPLIVHIADAGQLPSVAMDITDSALALLDAFSPGPLTVVLPKHANICAEATGGLESVGVRIPKHPLAAAFLQATELPIAAPSANLSGRPSPTTWQAVVEDLEGRIDAVLRGEPTQIGLESTVVDCTTDSPTLLRTGAISLSQLQQVVPSTRASVDNGSRSGTEHLRRSPGTRHPHYQPTAEVDLVDRVSTVPSAAPDAAYIGFAPLPDGNWMWHEVFDSLEDFARGYYEALREADRRHARRIVVELARGDSPIVDALRDRQRRSAGHQP